MAAPALVGVDEAAEPPVTLANTKAEIAEAAYEAGLVESVDAALTYTKAELLAMWEE